MKVILQGKNSGPIELAQKDFLAAGGEGSVYVKGQTAFKIYEDPKRMLPVGKITELQALQHPDIIRPQDVLLDSAHVAVGYTMRFVSDAVPLCETFTRAFRDREGLTNTKMLKLVQGLQSLIGHIHNAGILIVDLNELNFLVAKTFDVVFAIDVDSYQTAHYPATAIMPSVKDWQVQGNAFTVGSDYFSLACLIHQMFRGIHPYRGKHPKYVGADAMTERMKANVSVFDPAVRVPQVIYPETVIPAGYRAWLRAVLQDGKRLPPPSDPGAFIAVVPVARVVSSGAGLDIQEVWSYDRPLTGFVEAGGKRIAWAGSDAWVDGDVSTFRHHAPILGAVVTPKGHVILVARNALGVLFLLDKTTGHAVGCGIRVDDLQGFAGRLYGRSGDAVYELQMVEMGQQVVCAPKLVVNVLERATRLFPGGVYQDMLGSAFVSLLPESGKSYQVRLPELDSYRLVEARADGRALMVTGTKKQKGGTYDRLVFVFSEGYQSYQVFTTYDVVRAGLNFVVLDNGVCVHLTEEEKLDVWSVNKPANIRTVEDKTLGNDMHLVKVGGRVGFVRGAQLFSMRMK